MAKSLHQGLAQWIKCKLGKQAVFDKVNCASLGFEPRTFSNLGSCATNTLLLAKFFCLTICHYIQIGGDKEAWEGAFQLCQKKNS